MYKGKMKLMIFQCQGQGHVPGYLFQGQMIQLALEGKICIEVTKTKYLNKTDVLNNLITSA